MVRRASRRVELEDILSSRFFGEDDPLVGIVVRTHLALECMLVELIEMTDQTFPAWKRPFPEKTGKLLKEGVIRPADKNAFDAYNDLRNDFAHIFSHKVTLSEILASARKLESFGVDFSDSVGRYSEAEAEEYYDGEIGVMAEISWCILFHAAYLLGERGGRQIFS